jgi:hypothetical protein
MSISLKDVVKPTFGFQGALQGAGTPHQAGIGGFLPGQGRFNSRRENPSKVSSAGTSVSGSFGIGSSSRSNWA